MNKDIEGLLVKKNRIPSPLKIFKKRTSEKISRQYNIKPPQENKFHQRLQSFKLPKTTILRLFEKPITFYDNGEVNSTARLNRPQSVSENKSKRSKNSISIKQQLQMQVSQETLLKNRNTSRNITHRQSYNIQI